MFSLIGSSDKESWDNATVTSHVVVTLFKVILRLDIFPIR